MPDTNISQILVIQDRSGSMRSVQQATIDGFNEFVKGQCEGPGEARLRLVQFDHEYNVVFDKPIKEVAALNNATYQPRGSTALLDAVGRGIFDLGRDLEEIADERRPGKVIVVIMTDGHENASKEFSRARVFEMVTHQQTSYRWEFIFLGANQDAIKEGGSMGIRSFASMDYASTPDSVKRAYAATGRAAMSARAGKSVAFTEDERKKVGGRPLR